MKNYNPMDWYRRRTGLKWVKRGARVLVCSDWEPPLTVNLGTVLSAGTHIKVRLDGEDNGGYYHESDVKPISEAAKLWSRP